MGIFKSASVLPITRSVVSQGLEDMFGGDPMSGFPSVKPKMENKPVSNELAIEKPRTPKPARQAIHILDGLVNQIEKGAWNSQDYLSDAVLQYVKMVKEVLETGDYSS